MPRLLPSVHFSFPRSVIVFFSSRSVNNYNVCAWDCSQTDNCLSVTGWWDEVGLVLVIVLCDTVMKAIITFSKPSQGGVGG